MGTDVHGWLERDAGNGWEGIAPVSELLTRSYRLFGALFGVRNYAEFDPAIPARGLPEDPSPAVRSSFPEAYRDELTLVTHATLARIAEIEWSASPERPTDCEQFGARSHWDRATEVRVFDRQGRYVGQVQEIDEQLSEAQRRRLCEQWQLTTDDYHYVADPTTRRAAALSGRWDRLVGLALDVAGDRDHTPEELRIVVWFSS